MPQPSIVTSVLNHYPGVAARQIEPLAGAGGFSGAAFWRVTTGDDTLCLRRWPQEHPRREQLRSIHAVLAHAATQGFTKLPLPFPTRNGETFVSAGHLWELTRWLPGAADFHEHPTSRRLDAALVALAQFHRSTASYEPQGGAPPGIAARLAQLDQLCRGRAAQMPHAVATVAWPEFERRAVLILHWFDEHAPRTRASLLAVNACCVPLQPCMRDIWHDHVLFQGDEVSGLVDFGALRVDHIACDISRLLGSLVGSDRSKWEQGVAVYQSLRNLSADELALIDAYDRSTVLLSGMNWVQWIAVEERRFDDRGRVLRRLDEIIQRLQQM